MYSSFCDGPPTRAPYKMFGLGSALESASQPHFCARSVGHDLYWQRSRMQWLLRYHTRCSVLVVPTVVGNLATWICRPVKLPRVYR